MFSLRPEAISLVDSVTNNGGESGLATTGKMGRFSAVVKQQLYGGASELLEVDCGGSQLLRVKIPARGPLSGTQDFIFSAGDAVRVAE